MNVTVIGLWHLGPVTAACTAAAGHHVIGWDPDEHLVAALEAGALPVAEPGLLELLNAGIVSGRLAFTGNLAAAVRDADVLWATFDTPVDDEDRADVKYVLRHVASAFPFLKDGALLISSSQLPVGSIARLEREWAAQARGRRVSFACSPENLRLGRAVDVFMKPDRVIVGVRTDEARARVSALFEPITDRLVWMSVESAEMTKHALNAFLATSVTFINEIAAICEQVGADAAEVERGLKSDARIGPNAYLSPGAAFAGGTLARDIVFLSQLGQARGLTTQLLSSVKSSNDAHRQWAERRLSQVLGGLAGKTVGIWGLTYKPGTDTLRRSSAVELGRWLHAQGAIVNAHDPAVRQLPPDIAPHLRLADSALDAVARASALVVATPWPEYREIAAADVVAQMERGLVIDANRFLAETLGRDERIQYLSVGRAGAEP